MNFWHGRMSTNNAARTTISGSQVNRCKSTDLIEVAAVNTVVGEEPGTKPLLVASTVWRNKGGIPALLDTGCNTSIIKILHDATVLTAASGENMKANAFYEATFGFKGKQVVHRMYILDKLACHQSFGWAWTS